MQLGGDTSGGGTAELLRRRGACVDSFTAPEPMGTGRTLGPGSKVVWLPLRRLRLSELYTTLPSASRVTRAPWRFLRSSDDDREFSPLLAAPEVPEATDVEVALSAAGSSKTPAPRAAVGSWSSEISPPAGIF